MKRYALVDDLGDVVSVAMWDGVTDWQPEEALIAIEDPNGLAGPGVRYENGVFIVPEIPEPPPPNWNAIDEQELNRLLIEQGTVTRALGEALFALANDVRQLQSKPALTKQQFVGYLKGLMRD